MAVDPSEAWREGLPRKPVRMTEDTLCERCSRPVKLPPGTVKVSQRAHEIIDAVVKTADLFGFARATENRTDEAELADFLTVTRDTLYRYIEKLEKRAGVERDTTLRF